MGFFSKLFQKKKGGTLVGNIVRGIVNHYTNGMFGKGDNMLK